METSKLFITNTNISTVELNSSKNYFSDSDEIIIYTIYLPDFIYLKNNLSKFLNSKELEKAQRFYKDYDRNRYIVYRAILKFILSAFTKIDVRNIYLDYHHNKKPYLASHPELYFNLSHSKDYAVIALSQKKVGLDIEYLSEDFNFNNFLPDVFDFEQEISIKKALNKKYAFYTAWTRKEAFVKALGKGIDEDFRHIPCLDGLHYLNSSLIDNHENWQVHSFNFAEQYLGALAFEGLSVDSKKIINYTIPNTMTDLLTMIQIKDD